MAPANPGPGQRPPPGPSATSSATGQSGQRRDATKRSSAPGAGRGHRSATANSRGHDARTERGARARRRAHNDDARDRQIWARCSVADRHVSGARNWVSTMSPTKGSGFVVDALSGARPRRSRCSRSDRRGSHRRRPRCRWGGQPLSSASLGPRARRSDHLDRRRWPHAGPSWSLHRRLSRPPTRAGSRGHRGSPSPKRVELVPLPVRARKGRSLRRGHVHNADPQVTNRVGTPARDNGTSGTSTRW
jgi:hypothetical protein